MPPASPKGSPRSASVPDSGSFQITLCALVLGTCLKLESLFPTALWHSDKQAQVAFKTRLSEVHLLGAGPLGQGAQCVAWTPRSCGRTSAIVIILLFKGHLPRGIGLDYTASLPLLPFLLWFFLYIFSCRESFLLVFESFTYIVTL